MDPSNHTTHEHQRPAEPDHLINCEVCKREIPASVAHSREGPEYILHFCGAECLYEWEGGSDEQQQGGR